MSSRLRRAFVFLCIVLPAIAGCQHLPGRGAGKAIAPYPANPRYFVGGNGKPLVLIGDYTWGTFSDAGYDYNAMLDEVAKHKQNLARVWLWWGSEAFPEPHNKSHIVPYLRPGPGTANDGQPKYDLAQFNPAFFKRLNDVCMAARKRGIVLQLIFFDAWMIKHKYLWRLHAYCRDNNINGVDGDPKNTGKGTDGKRGFCSMGNPAVLEQQKDFMRRVMDTVGGFDNVLFEIANENLYNKDWERRLGEFVHEYEKDKARYHLVMPLDLPNHGGGIQTYDIRKMHERILKASGMNQPLIFDTDGLGNPDDAAVRKAVWTAFVSGINVDYLDDSLQPDGKHHGDFRGASRETLRAQLGYLAAFAHRMHFWETRPADALITEGFGFALASEREMAVFVPEGGAFTLDLTARASILAEWYDPRNGVYLPAPTVHGGNAVTIQTPSKEDWVLWVRPR